MESPRKTSSSGRATTSVNQVDALPQQSKTPLQPESNGHQDLAADCDAHENMQTQADEHNGLSDADDDADDDMMSDTSQTSTILYSQEPYETFKNKVTELALNVMPGYGAKNIQVERMEGGSYNRVVGVTASEPSTLNIFQKLFWKCLGRSTKTESKKYVLRVPRHESAYIDYDVATLAYAASKIRYPVPRVLVHDKTANNALGKGYMAQGRLRGKPLSTIHSSLNDAQRRNIASRIAHLVRDLHDITSPIAGVISPQNTSADFLVSPKIETLPVPGRENPHAGAERSLQSQSPAVPQTTREFLMSLCERNRSFWKPQNLPPIDETWDNLAYVIERLYHLGFLPDTDQFHFSHGDLYPRNILVEVTSESSVQITGIVDWDLAMFVPKFMATRAPFFLWQDDDDADDEWEYNASIEPEGLEALKYKRIFERVAGPEFVEQAYSDELFIARRMFYILSRGIGSGSDMGDAKELREEIDALHPLEREE